MLEEMNTQSLQVTYRGFRGYDDMIEALGSKKIDLAFPVGGGIYYAEINGMYQSSSVTMSATELVLKEIMTGKTDPASL